MKILILKNIKHFRVIIFITDAVGLRIFTVSVIEPSMEHTVNSVYAMLMGVIIATFGGLLADILSNAVPDLPKRGELNATACLIGGIIYILHGKMGLTYEVDLIRCVMIVVATRIVSKLKKLKLPEI